MAKTKENSTTTKSQEKIGKAFDKLDLKYMPNTNSKVNEIAKLPRETEVTQWHKLTRYSVG